MTRGRAIEIAVDGGINPETAVKVTEAGARMLVVGSAIFNNKETVSEAMAKMRASL